jgi:probable addiction module antidote protein
MMKTTLFDAARYLDDEEAIAEYLHQTCKDGGAAEIAAALGAIARARGMSQIAEKTGLSRQALYKALSGEGNPELATIEKVADALGFRLDIVAKTPDASAA